MGSIGAPELVVTFIVALIVLGPERLPKMANQAGQAIAQFRRMSAGLQAEVSRAFDVPSTTEPSITEPSITEPSAMAAPPVNTVPSTPPEDPSGLNPPAD